MLLGSGVSRVGLRWGVPSHTFKWLAKVGASKCVIRVDLKKIMAGGVSGQIETPGYATARFHNVATSDIISGVGQLNYMTPRKILNKNCVFSLYRNKFVQMIKTSPIMLNTVNGDTI